MGSKLDVYKAYNEATWANPPSSIMEAGMAYLSDDFQTLDKDGNVQLNKEAYIGNAQLLMSAFKDFKEVTSAIREEGDSVIVSYHWEGTHTGDLDLSALGLGVIPASGKKVVWPEDSVAFNIQGDKIVSMQQISSGGIESFLAHLGVTLPSA